MHVVNILQRVFLCACADNAERDELSWPCQPSNDHPTAAKRQYSDTAESSDIENISWQERLKVAWHLFQKVELDWKVSQKTETYFTRIKHVSVCEKIKLAIWTWSGYVHTLWQCQELYLQIWVCVCVCVCVCMWCVCLSVFVCLSIFILELQATRQLTKHKRIFPLKIYGSLVCLQLYIAALHMYKRLHGLETKISLSSAMCHSQVNCDYVKSCDNLFFVKVISTQWRGM